MYFMISFRTYFGRFPISCLDLNPSSSIMLCNDDNWQINFNKYLVSANISTEDATQLNTMTNRYVLSITFKLLMNGIEFNVTVSFICCHARVK